MRRRPAPRLCAPLALVTVLLVAGAIVFSGRGEQGSASADAPEATVKPAGPRFHRVRRGDTLLSISISTDVPLERLHRLNGNANRLLLAPGQRIRLRPVRR